MIEPPRQPGSRDARFERAVNDVIATVAMEWFTVRISPQGRFGPQFRQMPYRRLPPERNDFYWHWITNRKTSH
jgi:hypothetical protein